MMTGGTDRARGEQVSDLNLRDALCLLPDFPNLYQRLGYNNLVTAV